MIIDLANVGTSIKKIEVVFEPAEIDLVDEIVSLAGPAELTGDLERVEARAAQLKGLINADVSIACTRCLEPIARHLEIPFRAIFVDSITKDTNTEAEISDESLDESLAHDGRIDTTEVVREQILLAMPEQIFCREDCKGLCLKCGSNLNLIDCKCADDEVDPRWAALKNLK